MSIMNTLFRVYFMFSCAGLKRKDRGVGVLPYINRLLLNAPTPIQLVKNTIFLFEVILLVVGNEILRFY